MDVYEAALIIGIDLNKAINHNSTFEEAQENLPEIKKKISKLYRQKAKGLHPDVNDIDDHKMKELNIAYNLLKKLRVVRKSPPKQIIIRWTSGFNGMGIGTTSGTFSGTGGYWF